MRWARRSLGVRRIGHTGTLDPFASGLLILLVGPVTRLAEYLSALPKKYEARARIGIRTDTHDAKGKVLSAQDAAVTLTREQIEAELATFEGCSQQVPPQFSAKKVAGERMYKRARRGETVQLPAVDVEILEIRLIDYSPPDIDFTMTCSSGTYVRAVVRDLGDRLGGGAHLTALRRTEVGSFSVDRAVPGIGLREGLSPDATHWVEPAAAVGHLTTIRVDADAAQRLRQGGAVPWKGEGGPEMRDSAMRDSAVRDSAVRDSAVGNPEMGDPIAVIDETGLVGIAEIRNGLLAPKKILATVAEG